MINTDNMINEIAYDSGYSSPSNFCAAFKKQYGVTPLKYRESSLLRKAEKIKIYHLNHRFRPVVFLI